MRHSKGAWARAFLKLRLNEQLLQLVVPALGFFCTRMLAVGFVINQKPFESKYWLRYEGRLMSAGRRSSDSKLQREPTAMPTERQSFTAAPRRHGARSHVRSTVLIRTTGVVAVWLGVTSVV